MAKSPVIFRVFMQAGAREVIALFPCELGSWDKNTCNSYTHTGQHGVASVYITRRGYSRPASPEEAAPLARELHGLGYELDIIERFSPAHRRARLAEYARRYT